MSDSEPRALTRAMREQADENKRLMTEILMELRGVPEQHRVIVRRVDEMEARLNRIEQRN